MSKEAIRASIRGRHDARTLASLLNPGDRPQAWLHGFIDQLSRELGIERDPAPSPAKAHPPISQLGGRLLSFGEYAGQPLDEIPLDRLDWYLAKSEETRRLLTAYLNHPELEARRGSR